jgi:hypothetical protein
MRSVIVAAGLLLVFAAAACADPVWVERHTVIPVVTVDGISSAKNKVGDTFDTTSIGDNSGGFPSRTKFVGTVTAVTPKSQEEPGSIDVKFVKAVLPDNTEIEINGTLIPLSDDAVTTDPVTGNLVGTTEYRSEVGKFTAVGAGIGLAVSRGERRTDRRRSTLRGAAVGTLVGAGAGPSVATDDVVVPIGTEVGILLRDGVSLPSASPPAPPQVTKTDAGATVLKFSQGAPYAHGNALMVPFRVTMEAAGQAFSFNAQTKEITISSAAGAISHVERTDEITLGTTKLGLEAASELRNGALYVPKELLELALAKKLVWEASTRTLTLL